jgi:hypothetical protein
VFDLGIFVSSLLRTGVQGGTSTRRGATPTKYQKLKGIIGSIRTRSLVPSNIHSTSSFRRSNIYVVYEARPCICRERGEFIYDETTTGIQHIT